MASTQNLANTLTTVHNSRERKSYRWIQMISDALSRFGDGLGGHYSAVVSPCIIKGHPGLIYDRGVTELYPDLFRYLKQFAKANKLRLQENRRIETVEIGEERRDKCLPVMCLGASIMLKETILGKVGIVPSSPHILKQDKPLKSIEKIIRIAVQVCEKGEQSFVASNEMIIPGRREQKQMLCHYQATLNINNQNRQYHYFEGAGFHALGYVCGEQFVLEVLAGGGPFNSSRLWGPLQRMSKDAVEVHLFMGIGATSGFGILNTSYYLDIGKSYQSEN